MKESRQSTILIGGLILLFVIVFLMSDPQDIFANTSFIDVEPSTYSRLEVPVKTRMGLGNRAYLKEFPSQIGEWTGYDHDASVIEPDIKDYIVLLRNYSKQTPSQPVDLLVMYDNTTTTFRQPINSYPLTGYKVAEEGQDLINVRDISWLGRRREVDVTKLPDWVQEAVKNIPPSEIGYLVSVKKLVIVKVEEDKITDRQVVLYFYIKGKATNPGIGMMRGSAQVPLSGSDKDSLNAIKELMGLAIPHLFQPPKPTKLFISYIADWGARGYFTILLLFFVPLAIIGLPLWGHLKSSRPPTAPKPEQSANPPSSS